MKDEIRIRLSVGLIAVAVVHAALLGIVFAALHQKPATHDCDHENCVDCFQVPRAPQSPSPVGKIQKLPEPPRVNYEAQGELKQQNRCYPNRNVVVRPTWSGGSTMTYTQVLRPTVVSQYSQASQGTAASQPKPTTPPTARPTVGQAPSTDCEPTEAAPAVAAPASPPPKKTYQIALFLNNDAQSQRLKTWFDEHPQLQELRSSSEFQIYTAENAIYRTRFTNIVPVEQFPVVLFQDATGGHIHAAGRTMIPASPGELYSDLKQGYELYQQAKRAQRTGAMKTDGYSWDDAISPTLYLSADDCPDGYCPVEPVDTWRPGDRLRDGLFDKDDESRNALFWMSAGEMATVALFIVAVVLLGFILIKRGM